MGRRNSFQLQPLKNMKAGKTSKGKYTKLEDEESMNSPIDESLDIEANLPLQPLIKEAERINEHRTFSINNGESNYNKKFPTNRFTNQKYNLFTFLPKVLYEQFSQFFNFYFLMVAITQFIPFTRIGYLITYVGPLIFVLGITIGKEAYDDYKRFCRDQVANSQQYLKLSYKGNKSIPSSQIKVGDLIVVNKDERIPADLILLKVDDVSNEGSCFLRTDQLDGETDWKLKLALPPTQQIDFDNVLNVSTLQGSCTAEGASKEIYEFNATLSLEWVDGKPVQLPVSYDNTLWANTVLASGKVVGLVVYTGIDTKAAQNTAHPKTKLGKLDTEVNNLAKVLCAVTLTISILLVALNKFQGPWFLYIIRFLILFSSIIPISLRVNLDFGKAVYAYQIHNDAKIEGTVVRTSTIPEELGRIEYLLTDKTGTLTQNDMVLRKIHLGTIAYSTDTMDEVSKHLDIHFRPPSPLPPSNTNLLTVDGTNNGSPNLPTPKHRRSSSLNVGLQQFKGRRDLTLKVKDFIEALALCHNVTPVLESDNSVTYQASSPDEVAIVKFTQSVGLTLMQRSSNHIALLPKLEEKLRNYQILYTFPFSSQTKRMGIVVKNGDGDIVFYCKGADSIIKPLLLDGTSTWLDEECTNMAREGLRTLVVAKKKLSHVAFQQFETQYQQAQLTLQNRNLKLAEAVAQYLEFDLELLGLTGVEDKLQENVKSTLETLKNAGLKIWMLTGDKVETACCIATSSKLVTRNQTLHTLVTNDSQVLERQLELIATKKDTCLVLDGPTLQLALDTYPQKFLAVTTLLPTVVACRCTPTQKAQVVHLLKEFTGKRTCAIGDGGNDVSMILAADVGVGIVGKEGKQAALAADFSIHQFSYLARLLTWHGRNSYKRSSKLSQFVIHRGLIISVMQAVFSATFYFAPIALYQGLLLVGYATVYTMAPVCSLVLDLDVVEDIATMYPELYRDLTKGRSLSYKTFFIWFIISIYQGGVIMLLALYLFDSEFVNIVAISFTALILNELITVALSINSWHLWMVYAELGSLFIYFLSMFILDKDFDLKFVLTTDFAWKTALITLISCLPLYLLKVINRVIDPPSYSKLT